MTQENEHNTLMCFPLEPVFTRDKRRLPNFIDEPTVGVDVGAKEEIYKIMEELTAQGKGIILISSYLPEVMGLSDRLFVMAQGRITGEFNYDEIKVLKEEDVLKKASVEG